MPTKSNTLNNMDMDRIGGSANEGASASDE